MFTIPELIALLGVLLLGLLWHAFSRPIQTLRSVHIITKQETLKVIFSRFYGEGVYAEVAGKTFGYYYAFRKTCGALSVSLRVEYRGLSWGRPRTVFNVEMQDSDEVHLSRDLLDGEGEMTYEDQFVLQEIIVTLYEAIEKERERTTSAAAACQLHK